jgi:hypothetical protein
MRQQIAHRDLCLARLGELRPVTSNGSVEIEPAGLDEPERADGGDRFPDGVQVDDCVAVPRSRPRSICIARPQVDNEVAVDADGEGRAYLLAPGEDLGERIPHSSEPGLAPSVNNGGHPSILP